MAGAYTSFHVVRTPTLHAAGGPPSRPYGAAPVLTRAAIGLARRPDAGPIAALSCAIIEDGLDPAYGRRRILQAMAHPGVNVAVAHASGRLIGFGIIEYGDTAAHLVLLGVEPRAQRRGPGARLVEWLEKPATAAGIGRGRVEARAERPGAVAFYRARGHAEQARLRGYYSDRLDAGRVDNALGAVGGSCGHACPPRVPGRWSRP